MQLQLRQSASNMITTFLIVQGLPVPSHPRAKRRADDMQQENLLELASDGTRSRDVRMQGGSAAWEAATLVNIAYGDVSSNADMVGPVGLEPTTRGLKVRCSTD